MKYSTLTGLEMMIFKQVQSQSLFTIQRTFFTARKDVGLASATFTFIACHLKTSLATGGKNNCFGGMSDDF